MTSKPYSLNDILATADAAASGTAVVPPNYGTAAAPGEPSPDHSVAILDVNVRVSVVLGSTQMPIGQILKLGRGAVVELDRKIGELVEVKVNDRIIARGEIVIVEGTEDRLGVTLTEIVRSDLFSL